MVVNPVVKQTDVDAGRTAPIVVQDAGTLTVTTVRTARTCLKTLSSGWRAVL